MNERLHLSLWIDELCYDKSISLMITVTLLATFQQVAEDKIATHIFKKMP